jgi:hypothetical protein
MSPLHALAWLGVVVVAFIVLAFVGAVVNAFREQWHQCPECDCDCDHDVAPSLPKRGDCNACGGRKGVHEQWCRRGADVPLGEALCNACRSPLSSHAVWCPSLSPYPVDTHSEDGA